MWVRPTSNGTDTTTTPVMIDYEGITFDHSINRQVAAVACICDFAIFEKLDCHLDRVDSRASTTQDGHCSTGGTNI